MRTTAAMVRDYWQHFAKRVMDPGAAAAGAPGRPVEVVDDGPRVQRQCFNRHPQCDVWKV